MHLGQIHELTGDLDNALYAYEQALRHDQWSTRNLNAISSILRAREKYPEAMEFLKNVLKVEPSNGEAWGNLGISCRPRLGRNVTDLNQATAT
jgi:general transcriptional corepressor CYC8